MKRLWIGGILYLGLLSSACITSGGYDSQPLTVNTLSLFNQRIKSNRSKHNWTGDWVFRRDRLGLIDQELRSSKSDIFVFQEMMSRIGSPSESDAYILTAGSLTGYHFEQVPIQKYSDTREEESLAVGYSLPVRKSSLPSKSTRKAWMIANQGYMTATLLEYEGEPLPVFNVHMPVTANDENLWYRFVQERIFGFLRENRLCIDRIIVAGFIPAHVGSNRYEDFLKALQLKDVAAGECDIESQCITSSTDNELFVLTMKGQGQPERVDRILVSTNSLVYASRRTFTKPGEVSAYSKRYGVNKLFATRRYGWSASVRFPQCGEYEDE